MPETPEKLTDEATTLKEDVKDKGDDKKDEVEEKVSRDDMEEELDYEPANIAEVEYSLYSPPPLTLLNRHKNLFFTQELHNGLLSFILCDFCLLWT